MTRINTADEFFAAADEFEGRTGAARIRRFAASVERGELPAAADMTAIAAAFRSILEGADPKKALALHGQKGRPEGPRALERALAIERKIRDGIPAGKAIEAVCNELHVDEATAKRARKRHGTVARGILEVSARADEWRQTVDEVARNLEQGGRKK